MIAPASPSPLIVGDDASAEKAISHLIEVLSSATESQAADILSYLDRGMALWAERKEAACPITPVKPAKAKKEKAAPAAPKKAAAALPSAGADASEYRIDPTSIDETVCVGRSLKGGEDKRWKPIIYRESQCGKKVVEGGDLCTSCTKREGKCAENPAKPGDWNGRVTEEPDDWVHMLGTEWATEKKVRFIGSSSAAASVAEPESEAEAEVESESEAAVASAPAIPSSEEKKMPAAKKSVATEDKAAAAAAAKATKEAEKAAAKAAKDAEKAAEKVAAKAAKEATAAAAKAEKAAAAAAAKAAKAAEKPKAEKAAKKPAAAKAKPDAKVSTTTEPVVVEGEPEVIDGTSYWIKNGNVYQYDEVTDTIGDFAGRLNADRTIDTEADEVGAAESDSE